MRLVKRIILALIPKRGYKILNRIRFPVYYFFYRKLYEYPVIYIAACPKSASTWLTYLLAEILPGFRMFYPSGHASGQSGTDYNLGDDVIKELSNKLVTVRSHTPPTAENIAVLNRNFGKYLVLIRDVRDVLLSSYYHIKRGPNSAFIDYGRQRDLPWKPIPQSALRLDKERFLDVLIERLLPYLVDFSYGWVKYSRKSDNVLLIHFEDLTANTCLEVRRILDFYGLSIPDNKIKKAVSRTSFNSRLSRTERYMYNFRKGRQGGWKVELNSAQKARCNEIAGEYMRYLSALREGQRMSEWQKIEA